MHFCFIVQNEEKAFVKVVLLMSKLFRTVVFFQFALVVLAVYTWRKKLSYC
jgi:hypothetical protein